jgi:hypothetical protein
MAMVAIRAITQLGPSLQNPGSKLAAVPYPTGTAAAGWLGTENEKQ